jgi:tetratricopeptide (TPR) repeat protein
MGEELQFRFTVQGLPEGEALTLLEIEKKLRDKLAAAGGACAQSLWSLAGLYQKTGHLDEATRCMQRVIELADDPEKVGSAYLALGQLEESRGDFAAAVKRYREALALEPCVKHTWYLIHNNLGYSLNQLGAYAEAIPYLQRAVEIDPARANAYKNLGLAHQALGNLERAAELFITATQVNAADSRSLNHLIALIDANPALEVDMPGLRGRVEMCQKAVEVAKAHQPDWTAHWAKLRAGQRPKWWQFWKRRTC